MIQNEIGGEDGRTKNRASRKCYQTSEKQKKKIIIAGQCKLREIVKTLCGRVYILYSLPDRPFKYIKSYSKKTYGYGYFWLLTHKKDRYIFFIYRLSMRSIILCLRYLCSTLAIPFQSNIPPLITFRGCGTKHGNRQFRGLCAVLPDPIGPVSLQWLDPFSIKSSPVKRKWEMWTAQNARAMLELVHNLQVLSVHCPSSSGPCSAFIQSSRCPNPNSSTRSYCVQFWALWK